MEEQVSVLSTGPSDAKKPSAGKSSINRVRNLAETAALAGVILPTLRRRISGGKVPIVTHVSVQRAGVTDRHREE